MTGFRGGQARREHHDAADRDIWMLSISCPPPGGIVGRGARDLRQPIGRRQRRHDGDHACRPALTCPRISTRRCVAGDPSQAWPGRQVGLAQWSHRRITCQVAVQLTRSWVFLCLSLLHRHAVVVHILDLGIRRHVRELSTACHIKFYVYPHAATCCTRSAPQASLARLQLPVPDALS